MVDTFYLLSKWFWNEDFWLPPNITWHDIDPNKNTKINYASFDDLYVYPWRLIVLIFFYRYIAEGHLLRFIGHQFGVKHHTIVKYNIELNDLLERELKTVKRWDHQQILRLSKKLNVSVRKGIIQSISYLFLYFSLCLKRNSF